MQPLAFYSIWSRQKLPYFWFPSSKPSWPKSENFISPPKEKLVFHPESCSRTDAPKQLINKLLFYFWRWFFGGYKVCPVTSKGWYKRHRHLTFPELSAGFSINFNTARKPPLQGIQIFGGSVPAESGSPPASGQSPPSAQAPRSVML